MKYKLGDVIENRDKLRKPISSMLRKYRQGNYRYYGAQRVIDHIDDFIFSGTYLLVAEDGENLRSRNMPIAQIVSEKFWVIRSYVLICKDG